MSAKIIQNGGCDYISWNKPSKDTEKRNQNNKKTKSKPKQKSKPTTKSKKKSSK